MRKENQKKIWLENFGIANPAGMSHSSKGRWICKRKRRLSNTSHSRRIKTWLRRLIDVLTSNRRRIKTSFRRRISTWLRHLVDVSGVFATSYRHVHVTSNAWQLFRLLIQRFWTTIRQLTWDMPAGKVVNQRNDWYICNYTSHWLIIV